MMDATRLYLTAEGSVTALIYQPPHPWGASDGPEPLCCQNTPFSHY